jgi:hypothetical protein
MATRKVSQALAKKSIPIKGRRYTNWKQCPVCYSNNTHDNGEIRYCNRCGHGKEFLTKENN